MNRRKKRIIAARPVLTILLLALCLLLPGAADAAAAETAGNGDGTYTVTIPEKITYQKMHAGPVDLSASYDVSVTGDFAESIDAVRILCQDSEMTGSGSPLKLSSGSHQMEFTGSGSRPNTLKITGNADVGEKYTGTVLYSSSAAETPAYPITYDLGGGTNDGGNPDSYTNRQEITLHPPHREGYTFQGWTGSSGTVPSVSVTIPKGSSGSRSYTAHWAKNAYRIRYELDGGTLPESTESYSVDTDSVTVAAPQKAGYRFSGWKIQNDHSSPAGDVTFTAQWRKISMESLSITGLSSIWRTGTSLSYRGVKVLAVSDDGTLTDVTKDVTFTPAEGTRLEQAGSRTVTASLTRDGKTLTAKQTITAEDPAVSALSIAGLHESYISGTKILYSDVHVTAHYNDGSTKDVSSSVTWSPSADDFLTETGKQPVTASYTENGRTVTASQEVTVRAPKPVSLTLSGLPEKAKEGETISYDGAKVTASFEDGTSRDVTDAVSWTPAKGSALYSGTQNLKAVYTDPASGGAASADQDLTVTDPPKGYKSGGYVCYYAVSPYGIGVDTLKSGETPGISFGTATGPTYYCNNYSYCNGKSVIAHQISPKTFRIPWDEENPNWKQLRSNMDEVQAESDDAITGGMQNVIIDQDAGRDSSGNRYRCIHYDNWKTILYWNTKDPHVYDKCVINHCTKRLVLKANSDSINIRDKYASDPYGETMHYYRYTEQPDGDGFDGFAASDWNLDASYDAGLGYEKVTDFSYFDNYSAKDYYSRSLIRAKLVGADSNTLKESKYAGTNASQYTAKTAWISAFPAELVDQMGSKKLTDIAESGPKTGDKSGGRPDSGSPGITPSGARTVYDKLWLMSYAELYLKKNSPYKERFWSKDIGSYQGTVARRVNNDIWLRDIHFKDNAMDLESDGYAAYYSMEGGKYVAPGFVLKR